jgi:hypothetical protein
VDQISINRAEDLSICKGQRSFKKKGGQEAQFTNDTDSPGSRTKMVNVAREDKPSNSTRVFARMTRTHVECGGRVCGGYGGLLSMTSFSSS